MAAMHRNIGNSVPIKKPLPGIGNSKPISLTPANATHTDSVGSGGGGSGPMDNLPKQFVSAMRTLFDIMDDKRTGYVRLSDIEHRWQDDGAKGLPHGVIDSLRKVTPLNGMLSFERFCAGLKICLLRNQSDSSQSSQCSATTPPKVNRRIPLATSAVVGSFTPTDNPLLKEIKSQRPPSVPLLDLENAIPTGSQHWKSGNTAAVRPNNAISGVQRALSLPKLSPDSDDPDHISTSDLPLILPGLYAPPKPPRTALVLGNGVTNINHLDRLDKAEIRHALQNWQMGVLMNEMDAKDKRMMVNLNRGTADGSNDVGQQQSQSKSSSGGGGVFQKKANARRREPRRHTLQNGIDYNMLKKLKQLEQEKDVLLQGLGAVENAQSWYLKQISLVQDKIKQLGKMGSYMEQWSEAHQERLDLQRARVVEVNRHLTALADSWERGGFPMHMNLAVVRQTSTGIQPSTTTSTQHGTISHNDLVGNRLRQQNRKLSDEVSQKNERIAVLERERQSLLRELVKGQRTKTGNHMHGTDEVIF